MRLLVFMTLLQTYACSQYGAPSKPRSVNLALETIVEFNNNDNSADINIIDKVRSFLDRVKVVIDNNKGFRRNIPSGRLKFTDFVKHALAILSSYEDNDLEDVCLIIEDEIRKYHYKGCKFYELVQNINMRKFMASNLEKIKNAQAKEVKENLKKVLNKFENNNFDLMQTVVVDYVNSLYGDESEDRFRDILDKLASYGSKSKRANLNLVKIIRDGIRSVIFDHYSGLDSKTRRDLRVKVETFWNNFAHPENSKHNIWKFEPLQKSAKKFRDDEGEDSESLEIRTTTTKHRKLAIKRGTPEHRQDRKVKRQRGEHSTKRRLTFITLYPEAITLLHNERSRIKSTKSTKHLLRQRVNEIHRSKSKNKKKHKAVRKIITEHEAVINVEKDTVSRMFRGFDDVSDETSRQITETTKKPPRKTPKGYRAVKSTQDHKKHEQFKRRRHQLKKSRKFKNIPYTESNEGLSIKSFEDSDFVKKSFRKSNFNDSLNVNDTADIIKVPDTILSTPVPDVNVIKRINDLEKELRVVKAQIKVTKEDSYERPHQYDQLDFWEGTNKDVTNTSTPKLTTTTTNTTKMTTTTANKPITTTFATTTKLTTKLVNKTFGAVFRTNEKKENDAEKKVLKKEETKEETPRNLTGIIPMSHVNLGKPLLNHSAEIDYYNDIKDPEMNVTGIADIERYLNESKPIIDDKNHHIVRKQMLEQIKVLFTGNPEDELNSSVLFPTTPSMISIDQNVKSDPFNFLDVGDDDI